MKRSKVRKFNAEIDSKERENTRPILAIGIRRPVPAVQYLISVLDSLLRCPVMQDPRTLNALTAPVRVTLDPAGFEVCA